MLREDKFTELRDIVEVDFGSAIFSLRYVEKVEADGQYALAVKAEQVQARLRLTARPARGLPQGPDRERPRQR